MQNINWEKTRFSFQSFRNFIRFWINEYKWFWVRTFSFIIGPHFLNDWRKLVQNFKKKVEKLTCYEVSVKVAICTGFKYHSIIWFFYEKFNPKRVFSIDKLGVFRNIRGFVRLNPSHLDQFLLTISRSDLNQLKIGKEIRIFDLSCSSTSIDHTLSPFRQMKNHSRTFI